MATSPDIGFGRPNPKCPFGGGSDQSVLRNSLSPRNIAHWNMTPLPPTRALPVMSEGEFESRSLFARGNIFSYSTFVVQIYAMLFQRPSLSLLKRWWVLVPGTRESASQPNLRALASTGFVGNGVVLTLLTTGRTIHDTTLPREQPLDLRR